MSLADNIEKTKDLLLSGLEISRDITPVEKEYAIAYIDSQITASVERIRAAHNE